MATKHLRGIGLLLVVLVGLAIALGAVATGDEKASPKKQRGKRRKPKAAPVVYEPAVQERLDYLFAQRRQGLLDDRMRALGRRGEAADRDALIAVATNRRSQRHLQTAVMQLGLIGDEASVDFLCSKQALGRRDLRGQVLSAQALGQTGDERAIPALVSALRGKRVKPAMVEACLVALARIAPESEKVEARLLDYAKRPWSRMRSGAMEALGWAATPAATARLLEALAGDESVLVRTSAARALGRTGKSDVAAALEKAAATDGAPAVRDAAAASIRRLATTSAGG